MRAGGVNQQGSHGGLHPRAGAGVRWDGTRRKDPRQEERLAARVDAESSSMSIFSSGFLTRRDGSALYSIREYRVSVQSRESPQKTVCKEYP